jgi:membrane-associated protein
VEVLHFLASLFLNLDVLLGQWAQTYGAWVYGMLFVVIFCETGLVVTPFLPGDSLIFTAGALAALPTHPLDWRILLVVLFTAAVLGDGVNYWIGDKFGCRMIESDRWSRFIKPQYVDETNAFFKRHGGKTISLARFFPFIRTFAPFMAGLGGMHWPRFTVFNIAGGAAWVSLFLAAGYFFGNIPFVQNNLEFLVIGIIAVTLLPSVVHAVRSRLKKSTAAEPEAP